MPTTKLRRELLFTEEETHGLYALWLDLRSPGRKGTPAYIGQRLGFNQWLARLTLERSKEIVQELRVGLPKRGK